MLMLILENKHFPDILEPCHTTGLLGLNVWICWDYDWLRGVMFG